MKVFHFLVYQITNLLNNKIYIGIHKTSNINDDYMGSGSLIRKAIQKYGKQNFKKQILFDFDNEQEMLNKQRELVNEQFLKRTDVYNLTIGGNSGWSHLQNKYTSQDFSNWGKLGQEALQKHLEQDPQFAAKVKEKYLMNSLKEEVILRRKQHTAQYYLTHDYPFLGKQHTEKTKQKMSQSKQGLNKGKDNPNYNHTWVSNLQLKESKCILKQELEQYLNNGWEQSHLFFKDKNIEIERNIKWKQIRQFTDKQHFTKDEYKLIKENKIAELKELLQKKAQKKELKLQELRQRTAKQYQLFKLHGIGYINKIYNVKYCKNFFAKRVLKYLGIHL